MKKRLVTFTLLVISLFAFSCAEEVIPTLQEQEPVVTTDLDKESATDPSGEDEGVPPID